MNISTKTKIIGFEKLNCSLSHIQQCLEDKTKHGIPKYEYFGKRAGRGSIEIYTKNGNFNCRFREVNGWVTELTIL